MSNTATKPTIRERIKAAWQSIKAWWTSDPFSLRDALDRAAVAEMAGGVGFYPHMDDLHGAPWQSADRQRIIIALRSYGIGISDDYTGDMLGHPTVREKLREFQGRGHLATVGAILSICRGGPDTLRGAAHISADLRAKSKDDVLADLAKLGIVVRGGSAPDDVEAIGRSIVKDAEAHKATTGEYPHETRA